MGGKVLEYEAKTIYREGIKDGINQGISQGIDQGIEMLSNLLKLLMEAGRMEDVQLATKDANARDALFEELGLLKK